MLPKKISICNHDWTIRLIDDLTNDQHEHIFGQCDYDSRTIYLDSGLKGAKRNNTFLHELFHALIHEYSIGQANLSSDLEEVICDVFANFLVDNFYWRTK